MILKRLAPDTQRRRADHWNLRVKRPLVRDRHEAHDLYIEKRVIAFELREAHSYGLIQLRLSSPGWYCMTSTTCFSGWRTVAPIDSPRVRNASAACEFSSCFGSLLH